IAWPEGVAVGKQEVLVSGGSIENETRKENGGRRNGPRVADVAPGQPVRFRTIVIESNQPLGSIIDRGPREWRVGELDRSPVDTGLRVDAERQRDWGRRTAQVAEKAQVQIESRIGREQRAQAGDRLSSRNHQWEVAGGMPRVFLETAKEESLVLAH